MGEVLWAEVGAFASVVLIDLVLAGDNAVVVGLAAYGLPPAQRRRAIFFGIVVAMVARIAFASIAVQLLAIIGLTLAGGLLLLWVAWKLWGEARVMTATHAPEDISAITSAAESGQTPEGKNYWTAVWQITVADISMSLDNVLAVAGAARDHPAILVFGLVLSVALMGIGANYVAALLGRHRWLLYVGLAIVAYVAVAMIWEGSWQVISAVNGV